MPQRVESDTYSSLSDIRTASHKRNVPKCPFICHYISKKTCGDTDIFGGLQRLLIMQLMDHRTDHAGAATPTHSAKQKLKPDPRSLTWDIFYMGLKRTLYSAYRIDISPLKTGKVPGIRHGCTILGLRYRWEKNSCWSRLVSRLRVSTQNTWSSPRKATKNTKENIWTACSDRRSQKIIRLYIKKKYSQTIP